MTEQFKLTWWDRGTEPMEKPDPAYPHGKDIDIGKRPACQVELPYPARRCGVYLVICNRCGTNMAITTAGRPDDPRSAMIPCKWLPFPESEFE